MKKVIFVFAAIFMLAFGTNAQVAVTIMPNDSVGYVEQFPIDIPVPVYDTDSIVSIDTAFGPHGEILNIDTNYLYVGVDTIHTGFYNLHAVANHGYIFDHWEVTTVYNQYMDFDGDSVIYIDSIWSETIVQNNIEDSISYNGWLDWDMGIPDMSDTNSLPWIDSAVESVTVAAYFNIDTTTVGMINIDDNDFNLSVHPNPTTGIIIVNGDFNSVTLYTVNGTVIYKGVESVLDLTRYNPGVYFVAVRFNDNTKTIKVIKR